MAERCDDPGCIYCLVHCPYCGQWPVDVKLVNQGQVDEKACFACPMCGREEDAAWPEFIEARHRQVPAISGRSIAEWKAKAQQLGAHFRLRWRSAMSYLDPVSCAALSHADDLMIHGTAEDVALALAITAKPELRVYLEANPELNKGQALDPTFLDDWF